MYESHKINNNESDIDTVDPIHTLYEPIVAKIIISVIPGHGFDKVTIYFLREGKVDTVGKCTQASQPCMGAQDVDTQTDSQ